MNRGKKILLRTDGNINIGLGHVYRCFALAQILQANFECQFLIRKPSLALVELIIKSGFTFHDLSDAYTYNEEADFLSQSFLTGDEVVVLDGYAFDTVYQMQIRERCKKLICIDDLNQYKFVSDVVINHVIGISGTNIEAEPFTKKKVGPDYAVLRKEFLLQAKQNNYVNMSQTSFFISMGGADFFNATEGIIRFLMYAYPKATFKVLVGAAFKNKIFEIATVSNNLQLYNNLNASQIIDVMKQCNIAICPASTIGYEVCCVNIPFVSGFISESQMHVAANFDRYQIAVNAGDLRNPETSLLPSIEYVRKNFGDILKAQRNHFHGQQLQNLTNVFSDL